MDTWLQQEIVYPDICICMVLTHGQMQEGKPAVGHSFQTWCNEPPTLGPSLNSNLSDVGFGCQQVTRSEAADTCGKTV